MLSQVAVYSLSLILPPLGLWPAVKYLRQPDAKSKNIGYAAIVLTVISTAVTVYLSIGLLNTFSTELNSQLNVYGELGF